MKVYIAGKITGEPHYKQIFNKAQFILESQGHTVMNPSILPPGFEHDEYMEICYSMIDVCEMVHFLKNWTDSKGARMEHEYAVQNEKILSFEM